MSKLPQPGDLVADRYRIERLLGEGGMGAVFAAHHEMMDKAVALKWLLPELATSSDARDRFIQEARAAARIRHAHVVEVYDVGLYEGALFMVMELLSGRSFEELLREGPMPVAQALELLLDAMEGVAAAHDKGIVHRDIKPDNIFIAFDEAHPKRVAKVLDFGISKLNDEQNKIGNITRTGSVIGTPAYMSMEQMSGARDIDGRTDVYSFGVLLYRTLTGQLPFNGTTLSSIAIQIATEEPKRPSSLRHDLPSALEDVVMRAMARDREHRFGSMREFMAALRDVQGSLTGSRTVFSQTVIAKQDSVRESQGAASRPQPAPSQPGPQPSDSSGVAGADSAWDMHTPVDTAEPQPTPLATRESQSGTKFAWALGGAILVVALATAAWLLLSPPAPEPELAGSDAPASESESEPARAATTLPAEPEPESEPTPELAAEAPPAVAEVAEPPREAEAELPRGVSPPASEARPRPSRAKRRTHREPARAAKPAPPEVVAPKPALEPKPSVAPVEAKAPSRPTAPAAPTKPEVRTPAAPKRSGGLSREDF